MGNTTPWGLKITTSIAWNLRTLENHVLRPYNDLLQFLAEFFLDEFTEWDLSVIIFT